MSVKQVTLHDAARYDADEWADLPVKRVWADKVCRVARVSNQHR